MEFLAGFSSKITFEERHLSHSGELLSYGYLLNQAGSTIPFIGNQYFPHLEGQYSSTESTFFEDYFSKYDRYEAFIEQRVNRPYVDIYSSYQPFNESFRSLFPFLKIALQKIKPGRPILNLWDRNGWTTALLINMFPHNPIYSVWEGDKDVLGYQGYAFWFGQNDNLKVLFCQLDKKLPLPTDFFDLVVGYDALHRFELKPLLSEINRITNEDSAIIFPHVHLSNSEPFPFFERGGIRLHGLEYQHHFDNDVANGRSGYVFSEPNLFELNDISQDGVERELLSEPETEDYNALIALLPKSWQSNRLSPMRLTDLTKRYDSSDIRVIINPLYDFNLSTYTVKLSLADSEVNQLLARHPVYQSWLQEEISLTSFQTITIFLVQLGYTIEEIILKTHHDFDVLGELALLESLGLVQCLPLSLKHLSMQMFIGKQKILKAIPDLGQFWKDTANAYGDRDYVRLYDESVFTYSEIDELVQLTAQRLGINYSNGDSIAIISEPHLESIVLFWAAMLNGIIIVPINKNWNNETIQCIFEEVKPAIMFVSESNKSIISSLEPVEHVIFDSELSEANDHVYFSTWLEQSEEYNETKSISAGSEISPSNIAAILYTSGSTGHPKGVQLDHQALYWSGRNMSSHFNWHSDDVYFCIGGMEFMSGLRNITTSPAHAGCSIYIPDPTSISSLVKIAEELSQSGSTIIATNPHFLTGLVSLEHHLSLDNVRLVLCTGNLLTQSLRKKLFEAYHLPVFNYYGHTETAGICVAQSTSDELDRIESSIGKAVNAIVQIVDENDQILRDGQIGQIRIFSPSLTCGYLNHSKSAFKNGWYYTADLGCINDTGDIEFMGREREIVKTPNEQTIYLAVFEQCLANLSWIKNSIAQSHHNDDLERLVLFVETHSGMAPKNPNNHIIQLIREQITIEAIPTTIIYNADLNYVNGKISKETLNNEMRNKQVI